MAFFLLALFLQIDNNGGYPNRGRGGGRGRGWGYRGRFLHFGAGSLYENNMACTNLTNHFKHFFSDRYGI